MKILLWILRIGSLAAACSIVPEGDLAILMTAVTWALTAYIECKY